MKKTWKMVLIVVIAIVLGTTISFATERNFYLDDVESEVDETYDYLMNVLSTDDVITDDIAENITKDVKENTELGYVKGDLYKADESVIIQDDVNGNVYVVGNNVNISSSKIEGNIFVLGENIVIASDVEGAIYAFANNFEFLGKANDLYIISNSVNLTEEANVYRDARIWGQNINIEGTICGSLYSDSGSLNIGENGVIFDDVYYTKIITGNQENIGNLIKKESATTNIDTEQIEQGINEFFEVLYSILMIIKFTTVVIILIIVMLICSKKDIYETDMKEKFVEDLLKGLIFTIVIPIFAIIVMITIIGIPISIIVLILYVLMFNFINIPIASIELAKLILNRSANSRVKIWFVAVLIYLGIIVLQNVPVAGALSSAVMSIYGFGYIIRKLFIKKEDLQDKSVDIVEK